MPSPSCRDSENEPLLFAAGADGGAVAAAFAGGDVAAPLAAGTAAAAEKESPGSGPLPAGIVGRALIGSADGPDKVRPTGSVLAAAVAVPAVGLVAVGRALLGSAGGPDKVRATAPDAC